MTDHSYIACFQAQVIRNFFGRPVSTEREQHHRALAFREVAKATEQAPALRLRADFRVHRDSFLDVRLEQLLAPRAPTSQLQYRQACSAKHERHHLFGLPKLAGPQMLESDEKDLLDEIRRRVPVTQMLEPVEADSRRETPAEFSLGVARDCRPRRDDRMHQRGLISFGEWRFRHGASICEPPSAKEV